MAARKKSSNKSNHGMRTHEGLLSITPSTSLNASLINPKFTPLPKSEFSSKFQTKGTRTPIKNDFLIKPSAKGKYEQTSVPQSIDVTSYKSAQPAKGPGKYNVLQGRQWIALSKADWNTWAANEASITAITAQNTSRTNALNTARSSYNKAIGIRTVASGRSKGGSGSGSVGANGVL